MKIQYPRATAMSILMLSLVHFSPVVASEFSPQEIQRHRQGIGKLIQVSAQCLDDTYAEHEAFFEKYHFSKFFGDRRKDYARSEGRIQAIEEVGYSRQDAEILVRKTEPMSCVGLSIRCLKKGFEASGQSDLWQKVYGFLAENDFDGTFLQADLHRLGWRILYWNPNPARNNAWDLADKERFPGKGGWNPAWGGHAYRYSEVKNKGTYYNVPVDDSITLVGFGTQVPASLRDTPFFIGTAHAGYHVFPGRRGTVIEAHSMRELSSRDNLENSPFNPLETGGGPRWTNIEHYLSGIIAVPPGY